MYRQVKFPASAVGRLFNVLEIFGTVLAAHRTAAKEIRTATYVLRQCSFRTIISQCYSVLSSVLMTNIQFAPVTPPGFRRARRGRPVQGTNVAQGTPYQKPKKCGFGPLFFGTRPIHFLFTYFAVHFFRSGGGMAPVPPPLATSLGTAH